MLEVHVEQLTVSPQVAVEELERVYRALLKAAERENDLRSFLSAELTLASLDSCRWALLQPQCYIGPPRYLKAEPTDSPSDLFRARCRFVYNAAIG